MVLLDFVAKENTRARSISRLVDSQKPEEATQFASQTVTLFKQENELLALGTLSLTLQDSNDEEILAVPQDCTSFCIGQMSDGERKTAIIASTKRDLRVLQYFGLNSHVCLLLLTSYVPVVSLGIV